MQGEKKEALDGSSDRPRKKKVIEECLIRYKTERKIEWGTCVY